MNQAVVLPAGWATATLGDLLTVIRGVTYRGPDARSEPQDGFLPLLRATNISRELAFRDLTYVPAHYVAREQLLQEGDLVLAASSGSASVVGKAARLRHAWWGTFGAFCFGLRTASAMDSAFVACFLQTNEYRHRISRLAAGVNINNLRREHIESIPIRVPPLPEQRRIVSAIEEQITRLDAAVASLKRARTNLKRYRSSVLKAAVEGRFVPTEAELARIEARSYESATRLLARIAAERRSRWQADQLSKMRLAERVPRDERWKLNYEEPAPPQFDNLPHIPAGWAWATVEQLGAIGEQPVLTGPFGTTLSSAEFTDSGVPVLTIGCLTDNGIRLDKAMYVEEAKARKLDRYRLRAGDMLFSRMATVGRAGITPEPLAGALINYHIMRLRLHEAALLPGYYFAFVRGSPEVEAHVRRVNHGATRDGINTEQLLAMPVAVPPLSEQQRIVTEVERRLSVVEEMEAAVEANLKRAERLRQSILKRGFEGKLVPQDPTDEPASVLLERILAERATSATNGSQRGRRDRRQIGTPMRPHLQETLAL